MTDIDTRIRGALDADDEAFLAALAPDRGMFQAWRSPMPSTAR